MSASVHYNNKWLFNIIDECDAYDDEKLSKGKIIPNNSIKNMDKEYNFSNLSTLINDVLEFIERKCYEAKNNFTIKLIGLIKVIMSKVIENNLCCDRYELLVRLTTSFQYIPSVFEEMFINNADYKYTERYQVIKNDKEHNINKPVAFNTYIPQFFEQHNIIVPPNIKKLIIDKFQDLTIQLKTNEQFSPNGLLSVYLLGIDILIDHKKKTNTNHPEITYLISLH